MLISGNFIFYLLSAISGVLFINTLNHLYLLILIVVLLIQLFKSSYQNIFVSIGIFAIFCFYRVNIKPEINSVSSEYLVYQVKENYCLVKNDNINYYLSCKECPFSVGDTLKIDAKIEEIDFDCDLYSFDFTKYLNNNRVFYTITYDNDIEIISSSSSINCKIINYLTSKMKDDSFIMSRMLLFNDKSVDQTLYEDIIDLNAASFFVVSGFHISFFYELFYFLFKRINKKYANYLSLFISFLYVLLLNFPISALKALICLFINKLPTNKFLTKLDALGISGLVILLIEPLNVFNLSFILTFVVTFFIYIFPKVFKNKLLNNVLSTSIATISLLPIILSINYKINPICFALNALLTYLIPVIFVLCIISIPLSFFNIDIFNYVYKYFFIGISYINKNTGSLIFGKVESLAIFMFYILLMSIFIFLIKKKYSRLLISIPLLTIFLVLLYNKNLLRQYQEVIFLNVYQGDCSIILDANSNDAILIDTGGIKNYDIAIKKIIPTLEYLGIKRISYCIITHDDYDHCGALDSLCLNYNVSNIIRNNEFNDLKVKNISFTNLNKNNVLGEDNENSLVLYTNICNQNIIFMGDAPASVEKDIIKNNNVSVDIIKIGHHGSKSSTSETFIQAISPSYAIISVGKNNIYHHPNINVLNILDKYNVLTYRTDENGTIVLTNQNKKLNILVSHD